LKGCARHWCWAKRFDRERNPHLWYHTL